MPPRKKQNTGRPTRARADTTGDGDAPHKGKNPTSADNGSYNAADKEKTPPPERKLSKIPND